MNSAERFGAWVRHWRLDRDWTQDQLGEMAGMDGPRIQKLEKGGENPTIDTIDRITVALGRDVSELFAPRPEHGAGRVGDQGEGSTFLDRAILSAKAQPGTWRSDVADALAALARALGRDVDRGSDTQRPETAGR